MKLCCSIPGENMDDFSLLNSERLFVQLLKGKIEGEFTDEGINMHKEWYIADFPEETDYFLKLYESGGGMTKTGLGQIICGIKGAKLKPTEVYTTGHLSNAVHAEFQEKEAMQITSTKNGIITIVYAQVALHQNMYVKIALLDIWKGNIQYLPNTFGYFTEAINAAYEKANTFHCREAMYIKS